MEAVSCVEVWGDNHTYTLCYHADADMGFINEYRQKYQTTQIPVRDVINKTVADFTHEKNQQYLFLSLCT